MERTPIKIPNKRKAKAKKNGKIAQLNPRDRGLKLTPSSKTLGGSNSKSSTNGFPRKREMKNIKSKLKMSLLEKLPTELLERVYLYAMDINLPRSSPIIAGKLSREMIYIKTVLAAFDPTWDGHGRRGISEDPNAASFQTAILRCRWASLDIILKAKTTVFQQFASNREYKPRWFISEFIKKEDFQSEPSIQMTPAEFLAADFARFTSFHSQELIHYNFSWLTNHNVETGVEIPKSLLVGPWSEENVRHLFWLAKSGAKVDFSTSTSGELASRGFRNAISAGNTRVMHLLLWVVHRKLFKRIMDEDTVAYAMRYAGAKKLHVANHLLMHFSLMPGGSRFFWDATQVVEEIESEALRRNDRNTVGFIDAVKESFWYGKIKAASFPGVLKQYGSVTRKYNL